MTGHALGDLLDAAARAPASDAPRLALADRLARDGDPLAGFLRTELARAADDRRHGRRRPDPAAVAEHGDRMTREDAIARWLALTPELAFIPARRLSVVRGMLGKVRIKWSDLERTDAGGPWWRRAPIQHLDLVGKRRPGDFERLVALPLLAQLESLSLAASELTDAEARLLATVELPALRWLDLEENRIGPDGMEAMVAGGRWPRLVIARLEFNRASAAEVALYESDLGTDAVALSQGRRGAPDELGNTWGDYVQDTQMTATAEAIAAHHGRRLWTRVWWRSRREIPVRTHLWNELRDVDIAGEDCGGAVFVAAELSSVRARGASWRGANLTASVLDDCDFSDADLTWCSFGEAVIARCRFRGARLPRASFESARIRECDFSQADLRETLFPVTEVVDTSFQGAKLGTIEGGEHALRTVGTRFVRCDFRRADFTGRELRDTAFIDCAFADSTGAPRIEGGIAIERPDFSPAGDRSDIRDADALTTHWSQP